MENNTRYVQDSKLLHEGAGALAGRCVEMARVLRAGMSPKRRMYAAGARPRRSIRTRNCRGNRRIARSGAVDSPLKIPFKVLK